MVEGFWTLKIESGQYTSGGVAVLVGGKIFGGDNGFTWVGAYTGNDRLVKGRVWVRNFDPAIQSLFGIAGDYEMYFSGNAEGEVVTGTAVIAGQPQYNLAFTMTRRATL